MEANLPERLKDICQNKDGGATVQVAVVSQGLAPKGRPDLLRMGVVIVTDMRIEELAVEDFLWGELGLSEAISGVHYTRSGKHLFSLGAPVFLCWARVGLLS